MANTPTFAVFQLAALMEKLLETLETGKPPRSEFAELRQELRRLRNYLKEIG